MSQVKVTRYDGTGVCWRLRVWPTRLPVERLEHHGRMSCCHFSGRHHRVHVSVTQSPHIRHPPSIPTAPNVTSFTVLQWSFVQSTLNLFSRPVFCYRIILFHSSAGIYKLYKYCTKLVS